MKSFLCRKPLDQLLRDTEQTEHRLKRSLGPVQLTMLGIGTIVGAGIFSTVGTSPAGGGGIVLLRRSHPDWPRPFRVPWYPWVPLLAVLTSGSIMVSLPRLTWIRFVGWLVIGLMIYFGYSRKRSRLQA